MVVVISGLSLISGDGDGDGDVDGGEDGDRIDLRITVRNW